MSSLAGNARTRSVLRFVVAAAGVLWSVGAAAGLWWAGVLVWREVAQCSLLDPAMLGGSAIGVTVLAVCAGALSMLAARVSGAAWLLWLALVCSVIVLGLYGVVIAASLAFGLSGGSSRGAQMMSGAIVSIAPSLALVGANVVALLAARSLRRMVVSSLAWTFILSTIIVLAGGVAQSTC